MSASPSRSAFSAHLRLSRAFGHWWAGVWAPTNPPTPSESAAAWATWRAATTVDAFRAATNNRLRADLIRMYGEEEGQQRYDEDWGGVVFDGTATHTTQSGTLQWAVAHDGTATLTGYRRGYLLYDGAGERAPVGGPDSTPWWTATISPDGDVQMTAHPGAPTPGDRWEDDHATDAPQLGAYTWAVMGNAIRAAGGIAPELPPQQTR
jgi:hypothetical protein